MTFTRYYRSNETSSHFSSLLQAFLESESSTCKVSHISFEHCFYINSTTSFLPPCFFWLLEETYGKNTALSPTSTFTETASFPETSLIIEVGPRMTFTTAWSSNAVAICHACDIPTITRIERSRRYALTLNRPLTLEERNKIVSFLHDKMTEEEYLEPLMSFTNASSAMVEPVRWIPILEDPDALTNLNDTMGLGFDDADIEYYTQMFTDILKRNPSDVECFDLAQSNSEHSRHWFFNGKMNLNGKSMEKTLFQMVKETLTVQAKENSIIAFHDNSSVITGHVVSKLIPTDTTRSSKMNESQNELSHLLLTAETHNFPTGVAPFAGAETGTGGRLRDVQATGRGAHFMAGISGYAVGNLQLPHYSLPWEDESFEYPSHLATPMDIQIQGSNGASDYGNKFGEPVITGFSRSFGLRLPNHERREYIKPILFSAGVGQISSQHCTKGEADMGYWVVKVGGPCYRIGMGGGAASSRVDAGAADPNAIRLQELDFNAVQRGDAEMENKMNRVIRACIEMGNQNPIHSIHDQGAGGNGNVLKEIVEPGKNGGGGARYDVRNVLIGDETLSVLEIWGAEYQENNAILIHGDHLPLFTTICAREKSPFCILGQVSGDGNVVLYDSANDTTPVNLPLSLVLGDMPQKTFVDVEGVPHLRPLQLPGGLTLEMALDRVLRLVSVGSKRFLTNKVDRCVTGLIAQQQTVGPLQIPLADVGVVAHSHLPQKNTDGHDVYTGVATAVGEQPIKGLLNPAAMARLTAGEALSNLVWAPITTLSDVKCSANWMWAAKLPGEACAMYTACQAMRDILMRLGIAVDGGKDSLSMSVKVLEEDVKAPGTLVITMYAPCENVELVVTPDLKCHGETTLCYIDFSEGIHTLGGSALAHVYSQIGDTCPDVLNPEALSRGFAITQYLIKKKWILAGHDISDGGLITAALEMAYAGNCGLELNLFLDTDTTMDWTHVCFGEELGWLIEVPTCHVESIMAMYETEQVMITRIGTPTKKNTSIRVMINNNLLMERNMIDLRDTWEATSFELEKKQANVECVEREALSLRMRPDGPDWKLSYVPVTTPLKWKSSASSHKVCILREEGSNGDREMASAFHACGFEVWDVTMTDLVDGRVTLDLFRGIAFVGGFSFGDVLGSAKGWAGVVKFHPRVFSQFENFKNRSDTFSFGACNGCQLMALLGWVTPTSLLYNDETSTPRFIENASSRYESRFISVLIQESPSVMLKGMAGSSLGVWVAHGEGQAHFNDPLVLEKVIENDLAPLRYVNDSNQITEEYPYNPNGSVQGIAGLVSEDGRHLCMMPHPERTFLKYQWPHMSMSWKENVVVSPWLTLFQNAKIFCLEYDDAMTL